MLDLNGGPKFQLTEAISLSVVRSLLPASNNTHKPQSLKR
jgi:hypothetical protein